METVFKKQFNTDENGWRHMSYIIKITQNDVNEYSAISIYSFLNKGSVLVDDLTYYY